MGVDVYQHCINSLRNNSFINLNHIRFIKEHKQLMLERLQIIGISSEIVFKYQQEVCQPAEILWNLAMKYTVTSK